MSVIFYRKDALYILHTAAFTLNLTKQWNAKTGIGLRFRLIPQQHKLHYLLVNIFSNFYSTNGQTAGFIAANMRVSYVDACNKMKCSFSWWLCRRKKTADGSGINPCRAGSVYTCPLRSRLCVPLSRCRQRHRCRLPLRQSRWQYAAEWSQQQQQQLLMDERRQTTTLPALNCPFSTLSDCACWAAGGRGASACYVAFRCRDVGHQSTICDARPNVVIVRRVHVHLRPICEVVYTCFDAEFTRCQCHLCRPHSQALRHAPSGKITYYSPISCTLPCIVQVKADVLQWTWKPVYSGDQQKSFLDASKTRNYAPDGWHDMYHLAVLNDLRGHLNHYNLFWIRQHSRGKACRPIRYM